MTRYGVSIEKRASFRGATQNFANVYYYEILVTPATASGPLNELIDDIVTIEKSFMTNDTTWVRGRAWSQIGSPSENQMIVDKALSGTGSITPHSSIDRERALLVRWRAGNDSKGRPVFLRKYFHFWGQTVGGTTVDVAAIANTAQLTSGQRTFIEGKANDLKTINITAAGGINASLVSKTGRAIDGATLAHQYFEHRQLGDEWRQA